jgi:hypothetical protein
MNEVQHRIMGFLLALMKQEVKRYPDHLFVRLLLEHPDDLDLQQQLQEAFGHLTIQMASTT